ncbi:MAG TPA: efflux RND transporter periplasmic adaptor subunit [Phycisphaerae bacterium]|nr:efflux RND transporter periplasmic adaptor subunit [Phycisphaerales bacterium]HRX86257.1 efflux RND transporter periplasmic adaptor subunit [Phycisphaerae bacterium]
MNDTMQEKMAGLSRLQIERRQRPTASHRGWWLLAAIIAVVALLTAGGAWWYYRTTGANIAAALAEKTTDVNLVVVPAKASDAADAPVVMVANGRIVSDRMVNVATKVSGQIVELNVEQGDHVEQDQVLARVEDTIYRAQRDEAAANVAQGEQSVARAEAEQARAEAAILEAQADFELRERDYNRLKGLFEGGTASEFEYRNAKNLYESAQAAVRVAEAAAKSAAASVKMSGAQLEASKSVLRVWQKRLDDCAIRAPIAGVILERNAQVGDFLAAEGGLGANANAQLVSIADMSLLRVEVDVSERDIHRVFAGQRARITPDSDRQTYHGYVMWVDPAGDYARAIVQVKVRIEDPGPLLCVDGSAKVEFLGKGAEEPKSAGKSAEGGRLWLPKAALKLTPGSDDAEVFTVSGGHAVAHAVKIGTRSDESVEILAGVQPGMQLICENVSALEDGSPVRVVRTVALADL